MKRLFMGFAVLLALEVSHGPQAPGTAAPVEFDPALASLPLAEGDLIFRRGRSLESRAVLLTDPTPRFSHVGIVAQQQSSLVVIHAVPEEESDQGGVRIDPIPSFLSASAATDWAAFRIASPYHNRIAAAAAMTALSIAETNPPFDGAFDLFDSSEVYCTELIWRAYEMVGIDLVDGSFDEIDLPIFSNDLYILPSRLERSRHLQPILFDKLRQEPRS